MELTLLVEFVKFVTSDVLLVLDLLLTVFLVLLVKFFTREDAGVNVLLFHSIKLVKMLHALIPAQMDSTKSQLLNVVLVLLNVQLAQDQQLTVPHVFMDQFQSADHAQFNVDKTNSASEDSVLLVHQVVTDARSTLRTVFLVLLDTSRLDLLAKKDVFLINSLIEVKKDVLLVDLDVLPAQLSTIVQPVRTQPSTQEEESALTVLTHVPLVMELELAHHVLVDSSTSKDHARPHVLMELLQSMEFVNVNQESFLLVNV